jgi:hypothetical protein
MTSSASSPADNHCPVCGAEFLSSETCRARFERCLTLDYEHPESYGAVHHLVVACYMLQHNEYSRRGWLEARALVADAIRHGTAPADIRKRNRRSYDGSQRQWKIKGGEKMDGLDGIAWTRTIADVRLDNPDMYREDVLQWAESVLADTEE